MKISVAICTWNRAELLRQTLRQFTEMIVPDSIDWELIVVDNNSKDNTRSVVRNFEESLPVKYVFESRQGHSISRNTAVDHATGEMIVWTDNDVIVDVDWLAAYARGARDYPEASFFGGKIIPIFESRQPPWLINTWEKCQSVYAARDLGNEEFELIPDQFPFGANFAVRANVQRNFDFDTSFGRKAGRMLGEDEIGILRRMTEQGHTGIWLPRAKLNHFVTMDRATPQYVGEYFVGQGQANVLKGRPTMPSKSSAFRIALHHRCCYLLKRNFKQPDEWVSHLIRSSIAWGEFLMLQNNRTKNTS